MDYAARAAEQEREAERYPDDNEGVLLDAAANWRRAGEPARAVALLRSLVAAGGEDGQYARVELADLFFDTGDPEAATTELDALRLVKELSSGPCELAAELLEERGDLTGALRWYNIATTKLDDDELAVAEAGLFSYAGHLLMGRRRVRRALGMPPDDMDEMTPDSPGRLPTAGEIEVETTTYFWPRPELDRALARWPGIEPRGASSYYQALEAALRTVGQRLGLVPVTVDGLAEFAARTGGSATESATQLEYARQVPDRVAWPPPRNGPCWCGSGTKYKKCCGKQGLSQ